MKSVLTLLSTATLLSLSVHGAVLYSDDFATGTTGALNEQTVQGGTATWTAASVFNKDTSAGLVTSSGSGAAYLPMPTIDLNEVYEITARVSNTSSAAGWVGVGWTTQEGSASAWNAAGTGRFWMLWRGNDELRTFTTGAGGTTNSSGTTSSGVDDVLDMRIVMDGPEALVSYYYKNPDATEWTSLFSQSLGSEGNIKGVGFTTNTSGTSVQSYSVIVVPEPRAALLGSLGLLALLRRRR